jgi:hypothetical protein
MMRIWRGGPAEFEALTGRPSSELVIRAEGAARGPTCRTNLTPEQKIEAMEETAEFYRTWLWALREAILDERKAVKYARGWARNAGRDALTDRRWMDACAVERVAHERVEHLLDHAPAHKGLPPRPVFGMNPELAECAPTYSPNHK